MTRLLAVLGVALAAREVARLLGEAGDCRCGGIAGVHDCGARCAHS